VPISSFEANDAHDHDDRSGIFAWARLAKTTNAHAQASAAARRFARPPQRLSAQRFTEKL
jgi:hypothetical protein